jgi:hypothetical protein
MAIVRKQQILLKQDKPCNISHFDLCKKTAEWCIKKYNIAIYDYQSYATSEFPDVVCFKEGYSSILYEIKVSRNDFKSDSKKESRQNLRPVKKHIRKNKYSPGYYHVFSEKPHIGAYRYYVCPAGLINPEDVKYFGLIWYNEKNGRFIRKKDSEQFRRNIYAENNILVHAMRKLMNGVDTNIVFKKYNR